MKLGIGICNYQSHVHSAFFRSFISIRPTCATSVFFGNHPWDVVRNNQIINDFLKSDCTHFVKMDTDQMYPADYFEKMLPLLDTHDVIGPMIYDRSYYSGFMPLCKTEDKGTPFWPPQDTFDGKKGILEVPYLHTNCFFNRRVLQDLPKPMYVAELSEDGLKRSNHVDYTFMKKIANQGFKIYVNFDVVVSHIADVPISREVHERFNHKD